MRRKQYLIFAIILSVSGIIGMVIYQFNFRNARIPKTGTEMYQQPTVENNSSSAKDAGIGDGKAIPEGKPSIVVIEGDTAKEEDIPLVFGKITDEDGNLLKGVDIVVVPWPTYNQPQKRVETKSGLDGMYFINSLHIDTNYVLLTHLEGYANAESKIFKLTESRKKIEKNFTLKRGIVISGYVRAENGTAIPGANVSARKASRRLHIIEQISSPHTKTGENGFFSLMGLGEGNWEITGDAEGYMTSEKTIQISFKEQLPHVEIVLKKAIYFVSGKVADKEGMPIKGADVEGHQMRYGVITRHTQTDEAGSYRLEGLLDAAIFVQVSANNFIPKTRQDVNPNSIDVDFVLSPAKELGKINGRVLDAERGTTITRFSIVLKYQRGIGYDQNSVKEIESADGEFSIDTQPDEGWVVVVSAEGYETGKSDPIKVQEGETYEGIIIYLKQGRSLYGKVVDEMSNKPVSGAVVSPSDKIIKVSTIVIHDSILERFSYQTLTNSEGMFILNGIPQETTSVVVWHPDYVSQVVQIPVGTTHVQIMLSQGATLEGRVLKEGEPITNGYIAISNNNKWYYTEEDGSYKISGLSGGTYSVEFGEVILNEDGFQSFRGSAMNVEIGEYGVTRHDLILQTGECMIKGTVYLNPEIPAIGVGVSLSSEEGREQIETYTNTSGRYRFEMLLPGTYEIRANNKKQSITLADGEALTIDF